MSYPSHLQDRPNVFLIFCDQMRADGLGAYAGDHIQTPNLDALANDGVLYENMIVQNPTCGPSRGCLMTGRYCCAHRLRRNGQELPHHERTAANYFADAGYHTSLAGKLHLKPFQSHSHTYHHFGFEDFNLAEGPGTHSGVDCYRDYLINQGITPNDIFAMQEQGQMCFPLNTSVKDSFSGWVTTEGLRLLNRHHTFKRPVFLNLSYYDPHSPFTCPEPYYSMYCNKPLVPRVTQRTSNEPPFYEDCRKSSGAGSFDDATWQTIRETYYGMITHMDAQIGRFINGLKEKRLYDSSMIVFVSDHGEMLGDHDMLYKGPYHYDAVMKVPCVIKFPQGQHAGQRVSGLAESIDVLPTILQTAGLPIHPGIQGRSLLAKDGRILAAPRSSTLTEDFHEHGSQNAVTLRTDEWKYTRFEGETFGEFFNLKDDPHELNNLWDHAHEQRALLAEMLLERLIAAVDPLPLHTGQF
jgi:arylsulfatase A-like enzyme